MRPPLASTSLDIKLIFIGSFLHCFCRHCGTPLWVECDGILDSSALSQKLREAIGSGFTTIGVNMRAVNNIDQDVLENATIQTYRDKADGGCILDETAVDVKLS